MKRLKKRLGIWVDIMLKKNLLQYTVGLPFLVLASMYVVFHYKTSLKFRFDLLKYLWSPAT